MANLTRSRDLSAATDIESMSYTVTNLDPNSGESPISDSIDPWWPYVDLYLTPGQTYRIVVDIVPTSSAPGYAVGVRHFGDQTDFTVDWYYDTYVDLVVHPTATTIFDPTTLTKGLDPSTGVLSTISPAAFTTSPPTPDPADKFFFGPDSKLYYFSKQNNSIYIWTDTSTTMTSGSPYYSGTASNITIFAACADPYWGDTVYFLGEDTTNGAGNETFGVYTLDTSQAGSPAYQPYNWLDVTYDVGTYWDGSNWVAYASASSVHPTGIAVDLPGNTYITYGAYDGTAGTYTHVHGGVIEYSYSGGYVANDPYGYAPGDTYYTDVAVDSGKVYVASSPIFDTNTNYSTTELTTSYTGQANLFVYDTGLYLLASANHSYTSPGTSLGNSLWAPSKFVGFAGDGTVYFSQVPWGTATGWTSPTARITSTPASLTSFTDHP